MSTTISSREFNQNVSAAKRAAETEPVIITDRGSPAFVLMSVDHYRSIAGAPGNIVELLSMPEDIEFESGRLEPAPLKVPDLS